MGGRQSGWSREGGREGFQAAETTAVAPRLGKVERGRKEEPGAGAKEPRRVLLHWQAP